MIAQTAAAETVATTDDEDDGIVQLRLVGACGSCPISTLTLKQGIERRIMLAVPEVTGIVAL